MAYDEYLADRVKRAFKDAGSAIDTRKMMGGLCVMVDDKMCCGVLYDKKKETDLLMARVGEEASEALIDHDKCHPMDFTGRPMKDYVFVTPNGFDTDEDLHFWVQKCLNFNPQAKASRRNK